MDGRENLFPLLLMLLMSGGVVIVSSTSEVMERNSSYSCCRSPVIKFDQQCINTWIRDGTTFAYSKQGEPFGCIHPCTKIEGGLMTLAQCARVKVTTVCTTEGVIVEERISYHGKLCSGSLSNKTAPGSQGRAGLLLAVVVAGLFMKIC